ALGGSWLSWPGRAALRFHRPRNGALGRLDHAAPGRPTLVRKAASNVLADRNWALGGTARRMGGAASRGADQRGVPGIFLLYSGARILSADGARSDGDFGDVRRMDG